MLEVIGGAVRLGQMVGLVVRQLIQPLVQVLLLQAPLVPIQVAYRQ